MISITPSKDELPLSWIDLQQDSTKSGPQFQQRIVLTTVPDRHFGPSPGPNRTVAKWVVQVFYEYEPSTRVQFDRKLPTRLNWVHCLLVAQPVHPFIHIRLMFVEFVNSILLKSRFQQPMLCFGMLCSLQYRLVWNRCFTFHILYCCVSGWSIIT